MDSSVLARTGQVFISYRREDAAWPAGRLTDLLISRFGAGRVFRDVDSIAVGEDFTETITAAVARCDVVLVLIGSRWLDLTDGSGRRRLDDSSDFVRLEVETALTRPDIRVIPVLVERARMPRTEDLPPSLAPIVRRQAVMLSAETFERDANQLVSYLEEIFADLGKTGGSEQPSTGLPSLTSEQVSRLVATLSTVEARLFRRLTLSNRTWVEPELAAVLLGTDKATAQQTLDGLLRHHLLTSSADGKVSFFNEDVRQVAAASLAEAEDDKALQSLRDDIHRWERLNGVYEPQARLARDYWTVEDLLEYRPYAMAIAGFIRYPETRPPLTIGIKAPWGAGKTSLMRMIQQELDPPLASMKRSRQIRLRERKRLVPRRRGLVSRLRRKVPDETARVTNGELLSHTVQLPTRPDSTGPTLAAQTSSASDGKPPSQDEPFRAELAEDDGTLAAGEWRPTVWFNPWMYQSGEQVWAGLAHEIIHQITTRLPIGDRERFLDGAQSCSP
jgi:TIR domain/KAP family P-loop domain